MVVELLNEVKTRIQELGLKNIEVAPTYYTGTDHSMIEPLLNKVDSEGYEGLMCLRNMPYKCKRNNGILKCKVFKTADLKIIGFEEGDGRLLGTLGAIIVSYKGNEVNVGSGYKDEEREYIWKNRDNLLGRIAEVKYKEESKDKTTGLVSLQFPTFVCIREEGKEESYN
jgi:DNA ligase-1